MVSEQSKRQPKLEQMASVAKVEKQTADSSAKSKANTRAKLAAD